MDIYLTGGTGGIGQALVAQLQAKGHRLRLYDRATQGDLSQNLEQLCCELAANPPDALILLAGQMAFTPLAQQPMGQLFAVNLLEPIRLIQAVAPAMAARGHGHIITIGSMVGAIGLPYLSGYGAAKAALRHFNHSLRRELAGTGVTCSHVMPRAVATKMNDGPLARVNQQSGSTTDSPEKIARIITNLLTAPKAEQAIGWPERAVALLQALAPGLVDRLLTPFQKAGKQQLPCPSCPKEHTHAA